MGKYVPKPNDSPYEGKTRMVALALANQARRQNGLGDLHETHPLFGAYIEEFMVMARVAVAAMETE